MTRTGDSVGIALLVRKPTNMHYGCSHATMTWQLSKILNISPLLVLTLSSVSIGEEAAQIKQMEYCSVRKVGKMKSSFVSLLSLLLISWSYVAAARFDFKDTGAGRRAAVRRAKVAPLVKAYQHAMPAVMGMASYNDTLKVLQGTFLTETEADSIWPKIIKETKAWFGDKHTRRSLSAMERSLKKYRLIIANCHRDNTGKQLTKCLSVLKAEFTAGQGDFEWQREQQVPVYLGFYTAFNLMRLASLQLLKIQQERDHVAGIDVDDTIKAEAKVFLERMNTAPGTACEQRVQRITPIKTCKVVDILWQEYTELCEHRIRRSAEEQGSGVAPRYDIEGEEELKASNLGGKQDEFSEALRASVKDMVTGQLIYNKRYHIYNQGFHVVRQWVTVRQKHDCWDLPVFLQ